MNAKLKEITDRFVVRVQEGGDTYADFFDERGFATQNYYDIVDWLHSEIYDAFGGNLQIDRETYQSYCKDAENELYKAIQSL